MIEKKIVILALDTFGDLVLRQPFFSGLLDCGFSVCVVVRTHYQRILPCLDPRLAWLTIDCNPFRVLTGEDWNEIERVRREIAAHNPSLLVCSSYNRSIADEWLCAQLCGIESIGFEDSESDESLLRRFLPKSDPRYPKQPFAWSRAVRIERDSHECEKGKALLRQIVGTAPERYIPTIQFSSHEAKVSSEILATLGLSAGKYAYGCPAGVVNVSMKAWPPRDYVECVAHLHRKHGLQTLISGLPSEEDLLSEIVAIGQEQKIPISKWTGTPGEIEPLLGLIHQSRVYVGNDSGPMHFAAALGVPVVARFGGGHWPRFLPVARRAFIATQKLPCFGCHWDCPFDEALCMTRVAPRTICNGIDWVLGNSREEFRIDYGDTAPQLLEEVIARGMKKRVGLKRRLEISENDGAARLATIESLSVQLQESEADRGSRLNAIESLTRRLESSEADRAARLHAIEALKMKLEESETDRAARLEAIENLTARLRESEADGLRRIESLTAKLHDAEADCAAQVVIIDRIKAELAERSSGAFHQLIAAFLRRIGVNGRTKS